MAIQVVTDLNSVRRSTNMTLAFASAAVGDVFVLSLSSEDQANYTLAAPTKTAGAGAVGTITSRVATTLTGHTYSGIYTCICTTAGAVTFSVATPGLSMYGAVAIKFPTADGYSLATTPVTVKTTGSGAPSASITPTAAGNILVAMNGDWNAVNGSGRAYRGTVTEEGYEFASVAATLEWWIQTSTSGANNIGLTAPSGQIFTILAIEVLMAGAPEAELGRGWGLCLN